MNEKNKVFQIKDMSISCILRMLLHNWWMIVLSVLTVSMGVSLFLQYLYVPQYRASMTYAVTARKSSSVTNTNITVTGEVASVLTELLETDVINNSVRESSDKLASFSGTFSASQIEGSNFIIVSCTDTTPKEAFIALEALVDIFPDVAEYVSKNTVLQIIRNPIVSSSPVNYINNSSFKKIGGISGGLLMAALLIYVSLNRETVQTLSGAKHLVDANIIGVLGHQRKIRTLRDFIRRKKNSVMITSPTIGSSYSEQINIICSKLEHEHTANGARIFVFTGVGENEGKSTVSANVATMLALKGKKTAIVDGDFRKPALNKIFNYVYKSALPLNKMLKLPFTKDNFLSCIVRHPDYGLYMCFSDSADSQIPERLKNDVIRRFLKQLTVFDFVIIDTPPMGFFTDAEMFAELADASVLIIKQDTTPAADINDAVDVLRESKSKFIGCVLNDVTSYRTTGLGYGYGYGYGKRYGYGYGYGQSRRSSASHSSVDHSRKGGTNDGK